MPSPLVFILGLRILWPGLRGIGRIAVPEPDSGAAIHAAHPLEEEQVQCRAAGNADQWHIMSRPVLAAKPYMKQGTAANAATCLAGNNEKSQAQGDKGKYKRQHLRHQP